MYDNDPIMGARLAASTGIDGLFMPAAAGSEDEIKFIAGKPYRNFFQIFSALQSKGNRKIDARTLSSKQKVLITLNLDTVDPETGIPTQLIRKGGYSMRIRFEIDPSDLNAPISQIDFSVKTRSSDANIIFLHGQRGEWEAPLSTLRPSLAALREHNRHSSQNGQIALPKLFKSKNLSDDMFRVESIGACWRTTYVSTHRKTDEPVPVAAIYDHTEDLNIFTTPYADIITHQDGEAEAEFKGLLSEAIMDQDNFDRIKEWSIRRTAQLINNCSPDLLANPYSKATRAENALSNAYLTCCFTGVADNPAEYALLQNVRPEEIRLDNIAGKLMSLKNQRDRNMGVVGTEPQQQYK